MCFCCHHACVLLLPSNGLLPQFNRCMFKLEQDVYESEGVSWEHINFEDNAEVLEAIEVRAAPAPAALVAAELAVLPVAVPWSRQLAGACAAPVTGNRAGLQARPPAGLGLMALLDEECVYPKVGGWLSRCRDRWAGQG